MPVININNDDIRLNSSSSDKVVVNGNLGIGTTSPSSKFEVYDSANSNTFTITSDGANEQFRIRRYSNTNEQLIIGFHSSDYGYIQTVEQGVAYRPLSLNPNGGNVGIGTTNPSEKLHVDGGVIYVVNGTEGRVRFGNNAANYISYLNTDVYFRANGKHFFEGLSSQKGVWDASGNLGIGTTAPTVPLHIVKDNATINMTNTSAFAVDTGSRLFLGGKYDTAGTTSPFAWIVGAKENATDGNQAGYLSITTMENGGGFAERMRVTSTGNVGIGTTSPSASSKLTISSTNLFGIDLTNSGTGGLSWQIGSTNNSYDAGGGKLIFTYGNASSNSLLTIVQSSGNVGIGTTSPISKLEVTVPSYDGITLSRTVQSGGTYIQSRSYDTANVLRFSNRIVFGATAASGAANGFITFNTFSSNTENERMRITSAGNVGIGTTAPIEKLVVSDGGAAGFEWVPSTGRWYRYNRSTTAYAGIYTEASEHTWSIGTLEKMRLNASGNVGIGTTSPSTLLNVMTATNAVDVLRLDNSGGNSGSVQGVTHLAINHFGTGTNPSTRITAYQDSTSGWPGGMYFSTRSLNTDSAPVERMRITSAGNVGIGTTSPQYMLDVNGDAQINASGTGPSYAYQPDGGFGVDSLVTSGTENVALGKPDVWLRIHVDGVPFVFPGYQEPQ